MSLHCLGADFVGFDAGDLGTIFKAAGELTSGAMNIYEKDKAQKEATAKDEAAAQAAISADLAATSAAAKADISAQLKSASAAIDAQAAQTTAMAQDRAAAGLSTVAAEKRAKAADGALSRAIAAAQAAPSDGYKQAMVKAWTVTANKAHGVAIASQATPDKPSAPPPASESWFAKKTGPVPNWGIAGVGALAAGLVAKRALSK